MKLRYVGSVPTSFMALGLEVNPGQEFDVPDDEAKSYLSRADINEVVDEASAENTAEDKPEPAKAPAKATAAKRTPSSAAKE